tara:strand:+ start:859 stop:1053 length:195 start_codon:yes stop_codon:yes gene_type:complete
LALNWGLIPKLASQKELAKDAVLEFEKPIYLIKLSASKPMVNHSPFPKKKRMNISNLTIKTLPW